MNTQFKDMLEGSYNFEGDSIVFGAPMLDGVTYMDTFIKVPLSTLNRHGLVTGATGTGKTKSIQVLAEQLSEKGVPILLMDLKGDLSGLAAASPGHPKIDERMQSIGLEFVAKSFPVELLTISDLNGVKMRSTVMEFGPILLSKILGLNETQSSIIMVLFEFADDEKLPLLDLQDLKALLRYAVNEGKQQIQAEYGSIASVSVSTIVRKIIELENQGAEKFFGEPSFDVEDLVRVDNEGKGMVSILNVSDMQSYPKLFSTFTLTLLAEIFEKFPEVGDLDKPKLIMVFEEAHLLFSQSSPQLLENLETVVKLIRSKGVGIIFSTQNPNDVPASVLSQLGLKIQHSLRAFTAKDRKSIKMISENFPLSDYYDIDQVITELGIGEALVTALDEKGRPTEVAATLMRAPQSRMDILTAAEVGSIVGVSSLTKKYNEEVDRNSAHEILADRIEEQSDIKGEKPKGKVGRPKKEKSAIEKVTSNKAVKSIGRTLTREVTRGILGVLGLSYTRSYSKRRKGLIDQILKI